jgi:hypothetical protein
MRLDGSTGRSCRSVAEVAEGTTGVAVGLDGDGVSWLAAIGASWDEAAGFSILLLMGALSTMAVGLSAAFSRRW